MLNDMASLRKKTPKVQPDTASDRHAAETFLGSADTAGSEPTRPVRQTRHDGSSDASVESASAPGHQLLNFLPHLHGDLDSSDSTGVGYCETTFVFGFPGAVEVFAKMCKGRFLEGSLSPDNRQTFGCIKSMSHFAEGPIAMAAEHL